MTTRQLYYLVTISDLGSLSGAAQVLGISQPALSKFLAEYESSLGFLIFLRYHRQLTPTSVGRYVIECAQKILDEQTRMLQTLRAITDKNHARIRLGTAPNRGAIIYSRIYNQFSHRYPDIYLSLTELYASEQPGAILHGQIDLAIGSGKDSDRVTDLPIAYEELLVSLPVSHPLATAERIRLSDLKDTPFVLQGPRHSIRILAEELFEEAGFSPVVTFESNDVILVDSMLHQAVGAGLVSQAHVFPCEELVYRSLEPPIYQTLHIRYPFGHTLTEPERYLAGLLIRERLSDSRYQAIPSPEVEELLQIVDHEQTPDSDSRSSTEAVARAHAAHHTAPEINLNTQLLKYIIAIVDEKSLTKAAEKYFLPQPALSRHLRNVESMLCTQLFTRVHNHLQPTNAGKVFVNFARNILQMEMEMSGHIDAYQTGHGGGIYLQCDPGLTDILKTSVAKDFRRLHPDVNLSVVESSRDAAQEALLNASADFGLYFSCEEDHPVLDSRILDEDELVFCPGSDCPPETLKTAPSRVMLAPNGSALRTEQDRLMEEMSEQPAAMVCEAQPDILRLLSQNGAADTILPARFLAPEALSRSRPFEPAQNYYLLLVHHPGRNLPPSARDLSRLLNDTFENYFSNEGALASP
ncbi:LysR family transcriptional regulator [Clostridium sp. AN503]|uniref:LysR family transcriptional regulator n=1 Tax=Clostridium sp. AN503 TaxID=3160598 RepID=UPI00345AAD2B